MAKGLKHREVAEDNLSGASMVSPVRITGPGLRTPNSPSAPTNVTGKINAALGKWASQKLQATANKQHEAALMDGAMAATQGEGLDKLELAGGDKWSLQGHRVMTAATVSAALAATQKQQIADADFALDPEEFRAKQVGMLEQAVEGQDPRTARMIRETMTKQVPELVEAHTIAHTSYLEGQNYDALLRSVDIMSRDTQSLDALVSMATGGPGTASAGLSDARRKGAVSEGVVLSFVNDNPRAYDLLKRHGVLEDFTSQQIDRMRNAETQYQTRLRKVYNKERFDRVSAHNKRRRQGGMPPGVAAEERRAIEADYGIKLENAEMRTLFNTAIDPYTTAGKTLANVRKAAIARQDWPALAAATQDIVKFIESGNNPYAVGPVIRGGANKGDRAEGDMQTMPKTQDDPGWGIRPSDGTMEDNSRVGRDYWAMNVERAQGDLEAANIGYNAGPGNMDEWLAADRDYNVLPDKEQSINHWRKFQERMNDMETPTGAEAYNQSVKELALAEKMHAAETWNVVAKLLNDLDQGFIAGNLTEDVWLAQRDEIMETYEVAKTEAHVNHEIAVTNSLITAQRTAAAKAHTAAERERQADLLDQLQLEMMPIFDAYNDILADPSMPDAVRQRAMVHVMEERDRIIKRLRISIKDAGNASARQGIYESYDASKKAHDKWTLEEVEVDAAIGAGTVKNLRPLLRKRAVNKAVAAVTTPIEEAYQAAGGSGGPQGVQREAQMEQAVDAAVLGTWHELGFVGEEMKNSESALLLRPLVNAKLQPDPAIIEAVDRYNAMYALDKVVAEGYLTDRARGVVNAINRMRGNSGLVSQAMVDLATTRADPVQGTAFVQRETTQALLDQAVDDAFEHEDSRGWMQWQSNLATRSDPGDDRMMTASEWGRFDSDDTRDAFRKEVQIEMHRVWMVQGGEIPAPLLVDTAIQNVAGYTATIGGNLVVAPSNINQLMFGTRANQYAKANGAHLAVVAYLQTPEMQALYPWINQFAPSERAPAIIQDTFSGAFWGSMGQYSDGLSMLERNTAAHREVRPFEGATDASGNLYVQVVLDNGLLSAEMIPIPWKAAGDNFIKVENARRAKRREGTLVDKYRL